MPTSLGVGWPPAQDKYWAPLNGRGVIPGAYHWALPMRRCPLDHMLNPAEFKPSTAAHVREWSFLRNPRVSDTFRAARNATAVQVADGTREAARLRRMSAARVLHITNLPAISDALWQQRSIGKRGGRGGRQRKGKLDPGMRRRGRPYAGPRAADANGRMGAAGPRAVDADSTATVLTGVGPEDAALLTADEWSRFLKRFASVQGGWCCAPRGLKPGAAGFHLINSA